MEPDINYTLVRGSRVITTTGRKWIHDVEDLRKLKINTNAETARHRQ